MLKLAEKFGAKPAAELPMLFQRILQNTIRDFYRRQKVRSLWVSLFSALTPGREDDDTDPLETLESADTSKSRGGPEDRLEQSQVVEIIEKELQRLPPRQRRTLPRPQPRWAALRAASKPIAPAQHTPWQRP
jgi:RNA polymerase sigma-70 factor (ECF subfamily)